MKTNLLEFCKTPNFTIELKNYGKIENFENDGYKVNKICKLTIFAYNSIKDMNSIFYQRYISEPTSITKSLQLIDTNPQNFRDWACHTNCSTAVCFCRKTKPGFRNLCSKLY